jgi:hypothetical protein
MLTGYHPVPGVAIAFPAADEQPQPDTGDLNLPDEPAAAWMYLIDLSQPSTLLILTGTHRWPDPERDLVAFLARLPHQLAFGEEDPDTVVDRCYSPDYESTTTASGSTARP